MKRTVIEVPALGIEPKIVLDLKYPKVGICDLSGKGKTYIAERIRLSKLDPDCNDIIKDTVVLNIVGSDTNQFTSNINQAKENIIIIDDIEEMSAYYSAKIKQVIAQDFKHMYILIGKNLTGFGLNLNWCAKIQNKNGELTLKYIE